MGSGSSRAAVEQTAEVGPAAENAEKVIASTSEDRQETVMGPPTALQLDEQRGRELLQALKRLASLQKAASDAQIESRQKRREVGFLQRDVADRDAGFMKELQRLIGEGKLKGFDELVTLAKGCQEARDQLGPVERGSMEIEQRWEGQLWKLQQVEEELREEFAVEFEIAESHPTAPASVASDAASTTVDSDIASPNFALASVSSSLSDSGRAAFVQPQGAEESDNMFSTTIDITYYPQDVGSASSASSFVFSAPPTPTASEMPRNLLLTAVGAHDDQEDVVSCNDSATPDIDQMLDIAPPANFSGPRQSLPEKTSYGGDLYPELRTDFKNKRDMMNKWLEQTTLESHVYSTLLLDILEKRLEQENKKKPSNWSQLVIAYWDLDDAAVSASQRRKRADYVPASQNTSQGEMLKFDHPKFPARISFGDHGSPRLPRSEYMSGTVKRSFSDSQSKYHRRARSRAEFSSLPTTPLAKSVHLSQWVQPQSPHDNG